MRTDCRKEQLIEHLRKQGFVVGKTASGFVAVDDDGIVFTVSIAATHVQMVHPRTGQLCEHRARGIPDPKWFDGMAGEFVDWAKG